MADPSRELILLNRANQLLTEASSIEDVVEVRNTAEAARTFAKAAQLGLELQNRAAELKLRAERKAGAFLAKLRLKGGDRRSKGRRVSLKLEDLGVTRQQSKRWQLAALVPENDFAQYIRGKNQVGQEVTAAGLLRLAKTLRPNQPSITAACIPKATSPAREATVEGRAELLTLASELKSQCEHLRILLEPFVAGEESVYRITDRRYISRLARDIEASVKALEQILWNNE